MTLKIKNSWNAVNRLLTIINLFLFMVLNGQGFNYEEVKGKTIPVYLNVILLLFLGLAVFTAFYNLLNL
jgi:hypothetical protein